MVKEYAQCEIAPLKDPDSSSRDEHIAFVKTFVQHVFNQEPIVRHF